MASRHTELSGRSCVMCGLPWISQFSNCGNLGPSVSLFSSASSNKLFADSYIYSALPIGKNVQVAPDKKFVIASVDAMYADITVAAEGMKEGANKLADRILQDF